MSFAYGPCQSLIKAADPATYPHYEDLKAGSAAAKRITDKINEAQRHAENEQTVKNLQSRVDDWKGPSFGEFWPLATQRHFHRHEIGHRPGVPCLPFREDYPMLQRGCPRHRLMGKRWARAIQSSRSRRLLPLSYCPADSANRRRKTRRYFSKGVFFWVTLLKLSQLHLESQVRLHYYLSVATP